MDSSSTPTNKTFPSTLNAALEILATKQFSEDDYLLAQENIIANFGAN